MPERSQAEPGDFFLFIKDTGYVLPCSFVPYGWLLPAVSSGTALAVGQLQSKRPGRVSGLWMEPPIPNKPCRGLGEYREAQR